MRDRLFTARKGGEKNIDNAATLLVTRIMEKLLDKAHKVDACLRAIATTLSHQHLENDNPAAKEKFKQAVWELTNLDTDVVGIGEIEADLQSLRSFYERFIPMFYTVLHRKLVYKLQSAQVDDKADTWILRTTPLGDSQCKLLDDCINKTNAHTAAFSIVSIFPASLNMVFHGSTLMECDFDPKFLSLAMVWVQSLNQSLAQPEITYAAHEDTLHLHYINWPLSEKSLNTAANILLDLIMEKALCSFDQRRILKQYLFPMLKQRLTASYENSWVIESNHQGISSRGLLKECMQKIKCDYPTFDEWGTFTPMLELVFNGQHLQKANFHRDSAETLIWTNKFKDCLSSGKTLVDERARFFSRVTGSPPIIHSPTAKL